MSSAEAFRALLFVSIVGVIYVLAAGVILRWLLQRRKDRKFGLSGSRKARIVLGLAGAGVLCMAYGYFIEPYWLEITHVTISSPKLSNSAAPIRIAHISDIHSDPSPRLEERLPAVIAAEHPDLIVFTGDSINSVDGLPVFKKLMVAVARIAPTFVVKGNWDVGSPIELFADTGVEELAGRSTLVEIKGTPIWVAGVAPDRNLSIRDLAGAIPPGAFTVFLAHYPDLIEEVADQKIDLYCAGHTHGGQVALPFYGALITFSKYGKKYEAGLYRERDTFLYVNRGVGMEGGPAPRVRFWSRPELTIIDVISGSMRKAGGHRPPLQPEGNLL